MTTGMPLPIRDKTMSDGWKAEVYSNPYVLLSTLFDYDGSVRSIKIPPEIWLLAQEHVDRCDGVGIENYRLETLLQMVLYLDRLERPK